MLFCVDTLLDFETNENDYVFITIVNIEDDTQVYHITDLMNFPYPYLLMYLTDIKLIVKTPDSTALRTKYIKYKTKYLILKKLRQESTSL